MAIACKVHAKTLNAECLTEVAVSLIVLSALLLNLQVCRQRVWEIALLVSHGFTCCKGDVLHGQPRCRNPASQISCKMETEHACLTSWYTAGSHQDSSKVPVMVSWPDYVFACHILAGHLILCEAQLKGFMDSCSCCLLLRSQEGLQPWLLSSPLCLLWAVSGVDAGQVLCSVLGTSVGLAVVRRKQEAGGTGICPG